MSDLSIRFEDFESENLFSNSKSQIQQKTQKKEKDNFYKIIKIVLAILFACILIEIIFYKFVIPSTTSPIVSVTGQQNYSAQEIVNLLRPLNTKNWFDFNVNKAVSVIAQESGIESVSIKKSFPNKIYINVEERIPVAQTFVNIDNRSVAMQIDKNGVIFSEKNNFQNANVPIISGLPIDHLTEGMRIPLVYRKLIDEISAIKNLPQKYFAVISEICVIPKEFGNYELVLIPTKSKIRFLTDRTINEDSLKYMMIVLDVVNSIDQNVSEVDLRYGSISYKKD